MVPRSRPHKRRSHRKLFVDGLLSPIGGRKFFVCVLTIGLSTWLCFTGHLAGGYWVTVVTFAAGMFKTANVLEKR